MIARVLCGFCSHESLVTLKQTKLGKKMTLIYLCGNCGKKLNDNYILKTEKNGK